MKSCRIGAVVKWAVAGWAALTAAGAVATQPPQAEDEPPRILALLEHAWAAESGRGEATDRQRALALYCRAGQAGSPEGYFRVGLLLVDGPDDVRDVARGRGYLALAAQLGHERAATLLDDVPAVERTENDCGGFDAPPPGRSGKRAPTGKDASKSSGTRCNRAPARNARSLTTPAA